MHFYMSFGLVGCVIQNIFSLTSKLLYFSIHVWQGFQAIMLQNVFSTPTQPCRSTFTLLQDIHCLTYHVRYFNKVLLALCSASFYNKFVFLPWEDVPIPVEISGNPKLFPHFEEALGAMDGTHIACCPSAEERQLAWNWKGFTSQNCLAYYLFYLRFQYLLSGWDRSTSDLTLYNDAHLTDLYISWGRYYLADAGFGIYNSLLIP